VLANEYPEAHGAKWSDGWRKEWNRTLRLYVLKHIGNLPASDIGTEQVLKGLHPIWGAKTRTADEVRGQIHRPEQLHHTVTMLELSCQDLAAMALESLT
jgi:hypothetical protein